MNIMQNTQTFIYALTDPHTGEIRYIGKSKNVKHRLKGHITEARAGRGRFRKCRWLGKLLRGGFRPGILILETCQGDGEAEEIFHIRLARQDGIRLTNDTDGGKGSKGWVPRQETRKRTSRTHTLLQAKRRIDLTGQTFGRWEVLRFSHRHDGRLYWWCRCSCAKKSERAVLVSSLRSGDSKSCGCLGSEVGPNDRRHLGLASRKVGYKASPETREKQRIAAIKREARHRSEREALRAAASYVHSGEV